MNTQKLTFKVRNKFKKYEDRLKVISYKILSYIPQCHPKSIAEGVIVSLTSYSDRIEYVHLAVESIFRQTLRPEKIVLWLSDKNKYHIPISLQRAVKRGLEIRYTEDIRSYTKLIPALHEFKDYDIITIDDDCIYPKHTIQSLVQTHQNHPHTICYNRGTKIAIENDEEFATYLNWHPSSEEMHASHLNFAAGVGGVLYPAHIFDNSTDIDNLNLIMDLAPRADDLYFKAIEIINGIKCIRAPHTENWDFLLTDIERQQKTALRFHNVDQMGNDEAMKKLNHHFKLISRLKQEI